MREMQREIVSWVVYRMTVHRRGAEGGEANAVCEQAEWDEIDRMRPGYHKLVQRGIANEPEAERLARASLGGTARK